MPKRAKRACIDPIERLFEYIDELLQITEEAEVARDQFSECFYPEHCKEISNVVQRIKGAISGAKEAHAGGKQQKEGGQPNAPGRVP